MNKAAILAVVGVVGCGNSGRTGSTQSADTQETCVTIQRGTGGTVADTFIKSNVMRHNFGARPHLRVSKRDESLIRFDLSAIPNGVAITRASLKLFVNGERGEGTTEVHRVLAPWDESTVTYRTFQQAYARDIVGAFVAESKNTLKTVDLTSLVTAWTSGQANYGVLLRPGPDHPGIGEEWDEDNDPTIFVSSEGHNVARRPALEVCYTTIEVDPCADSPCQNGGTCIGQGDGYTCQCALGYSGTNCETNIDDCASNPCQHGGTCSDGVGSYTCTCLPGYSGTNCETDVNDCDPNPCQNDGVCQDGVNGYTCTCPNGYDGTNCEHLIDNCASNPCHNGGTCTNGVGTYTCTCAAGFEGENCDINTDDCVDNECQNGATCIDGIESYTCACAPDWGGELCEVNLNECSMHPCLNNGACTNTFGSYFCTCADGYSGTNCEVDIDDCTPNPCLNGGTCVDGVASFTCHCASGFSGVDCGIPDPAIGLTGTVLSRGAGFEISGANFTTATVLVYLDSILGCVVPVLPDQTFHTTSCFADVGGAFRNFPDGNHTLTVTDGGSFTTYAQVSFVGASLSVDGMVEQSMPFMLNAQNVEGSPMTDWWIAGRHAAVTPAWSHSFQQQVMLADLELGLVGDGSKSVTVRARLSDGSSEQLVGVFQSMEPGITLDPSSGPPGSTVHVTGHGFGPGAVQVGVADLRANPVMVDSTGHIDTTVTIPVTNGGGLGGPYAGTTQLVRVTGSTGHQTIRVSAPFAITGTPNGASISVTPVSLPYWGTVLTVTGQGFSPGSPFPVSVAVTIDDSSNLAPGVTTGVDGSFTAVVVMSPDNLVSHFPWVVNATENPRAHRASQVMPVGRPTVSLSTNSAVTGDTLIATVTNTNPTVTNLQLYVDDVLVSAAVVAGVPVPIVVARGLGLRPGALHSVSVVDMTMGSGSGLTQATTPFTIVAPSVVAGAASNVDGTQITVDGASFAPGQSVTVSLDNVSLGSAAVSADGSISLTATLPALAPAVHTVLVWSDDGLEKAAASVATH